MAENSSTDSPPFLSASALWNIRCRICSVGMAPMDIDREEIFISVSSYAPKLSQTKTCNVHTKDRIAFVIINTYTIVSMSLQNNPE